MPKYLTKHHQTFYFKKRLSKKFLKLGLPEFEGKKFHVKSLKTDSLSEALRLRDIELARLDRLECGEMLSLRDEYKKSLKRIWGNPSPAMPNKVRIQNEVLEEIAEHTFPYRIDYIDEQGNHQIDYDEDIKQDAYVQSLNAYLSGLRGEIVDSPDTLRDALKLTLDGKKLKGVSSKELSRYVNTVDTYLTFLGVDDILLSELRRKDSFLFVNYLKSKNLTEKTILGKTTHLSNIFKIAKDHELVFTNNPFNELNLSTRVTKQRQMYTHNEAERVLHALPQDSKLIWKTLYLTGLRPSELFCLNESNLVWKESKNGQVLCFAVKPDGDGKTEAASRYVPLHSSLIDDYKDFKGYPISQSTFEKRRARAVLNCFGEEFAKTHDTYSLRHTFITTLVDELEDENLVKWLVGHAVTGVTFTNYFHGYKLDKLNGAVQLVPCLE
jgi:site-specific recombinase XerD